VPCSASHVPRPTCHDVLDAETCVTARAGVALAGHKMGDGTVDSSQAVELQRRRSERGVLRRKVHITPR
jgi:hypothetical protein